MILKRFESAWKGSSVNIFKRIDFLFIFHSNFWYLFVISIDFYSKRKINEMKYVFSPLHVRNKTEDRHQFYWTLSHATYGYLQNDSRFLFVYSWTSELNSLFKEHLLMSKHYFFVFELSELHFTESFRFYWDLVWIDLLRK